MYITIGNVYYKSEDKHIRYNIWLNNFYYA